MTLTQELYLLKVERMEEHKKENYQRVYVIQSQIRRIEEALRIINEKNYLANKASVY